MGSLNVVEEENQGSTCCKGRKKKGQRSPPRAWNPIGYGSNPTRRSSPRSVRPIKVLHSASAHVRPIHTTHGSLFSAAPPGQARLVLPPPFLPPSVFWSLILDPESGSQSTNRLCVDAFKNRRNEQRDHPCYPRVVNHLSPGTRWLPKRGSACRLQRQNQVPVADYKELTKAWHITDICGWTGDVITGWHLGMLGNFFYREQWSHSVTHLHRNQKYHKTEVIKPETW